LFASNLENYSTEDSVLDPGVRAHTEKLKNKLMKHSLLIFSTAGLLAATACAGTVTYDTTGSTLLCNGVSGCSQLTSTSVSVLGLTFTYNAGSGNGVSVPSIINLGNIVSTGSGTNVDVSGLLLTLVVNSMPGGTGTLPNGTISGTISDNNSN